MADDTTVIIDINVEDNSSNEVNNITNNVVHLHQATQRSAQENNRWSDTVRKMGKSAASAVRAVAKVAATVAAIASASGPAVSGLLATGKAILVVGQASSRLLPLVSFLPAIAAGMGLVVGTLKLVGPGLAKAFEPLTSQFFNAKGEASALTKELRRVVGIDVKPWAAAFAKANMPAISHAMERIAYQTNLIVAGVLKWGASAEGVQAISNISKATADTFTALRPKIIAAAGALGNLAGRAAEPAFKALERVLGGILDKLIKWADSTSVEDINRALKDLSGYGIKLRQVFGAVRDVGKWLGENESRVKHFSDVAAGAAIAIGIATGNLPAIIGGAVALILNHWDQLKAPFKSAVSWFKDMQEAWSRDGDRIKIAESIKRALEGAKKAFNDAIREIGPKWARFVTEVKSAWQTWAPLIEVWWNTVGKAVFKFLGDAVGGFIVNLIDMAAAGAAFANAVGIAFKWLVRTVLDVLGNIINGAAKAFGWIPGIGPKLNAAAADFETFKNKVNRALEGIDPVKTIRINASVYVTGNNAARGGVDQRTGNSRDAGLSGLTSWQRVASAFAGEASGRSRVGGPTPVTANVTNNVLLDGRPFRSYTNRVVLDSERRTDWRARTGKR